jgi:hypothetical protein
MKFYLNQLLKSLFVLLPVTAMSTSAAAHDIVYFEDAPGRAEAMRITFLAAGIPLKDT